MNLLRDRRNRAAFQRAKRLAGDDNRVCGILSPEGDPVYFVVDKDATPEEVRARAFSVKHGRPMNRAEELLDAAANGDFLRAAETAMSRYYEGRDDAPDS